MTCKTLSHLAATGLLAVLILPAPLTAASAAPSGGGQPSRGTPEQRQTVVTLRNVGTAMFEWYHDQVQQQKIAPSGKEEPTPTAVDVTAVPVISARELEKLLAPFYIGCIPEKDGWGHPVEYRLNTRDLSAPHIMAVRSTGSDGQFAGGSYAIGPFASGQLEQDMVWTDGFFSRWPAPQEEVEEQEQQKGTGTGASR